MQDDQRKETSLIENRQKLLEQEQSFSHERYLLASRLFFEQCHTERMKNYDSIVLWGGNSVRTLFLLNGGAILAFLTFTGSLIGKSDREGFSYGIEFAQSLMPAFSCFIFGVCLTAVIAGVAYLNFTAGFHAKPNPSDVYFISTETPFNPPNETALTVEKTTFIISIFCAISSLISFLVGCYLVTHAVSALDI